MCWREYRREQRVAILAHARGVRGNITSDGGHDGRSVPLGHDPSRALKVEMGPDAQTARVVLEGFTKACEIADAVERFDSRALR